MAPLPQRAPLVDHPLITLPCQDPIFSTIIPVGYICEVATPGACRSPYPDIAIENSVTHSPLFFEGRKVRGLCIKEHQRCRCCAHAFSPEKITGVHPRRGANALLAQPSRPTSRLPASVMTMGDPTPIEVLEGTLPPTPEAMVADAAATALFNPCGIAATPDGMQGCADRMPASGAHDPQAACVTHH